MKRAGVFSSTSVALISAVLIIFCITALPASAIAETASIQTRQVLPPGGTTCVQPTVTSFTPYIYDGELNSFDFTISDATYVTISGQVGDVAVPFKYMTRRVDSAGVLHMHVDVPSIRVSGVLAVSVTLLSATGQKVCASVVGMNLTGPAAPITGSGTVGAPKPSTPTQGSSGVQPGKAAKPSKPAPSKPSTGGKATTVSPTSSTSTIGSASSTIRGNVQSTLDKICTTEGGAVRLWTVLLAVYLLIIAATILAQPPVMPNAQSASLLALAIVVPLLVLLGVWFFSPSCRVGNWVPIISVIIALIGFALGFRHHPRLAQLFSLPK